MNTFTRKEFLTLAGGAAALVACGSTNDTSNNSGAPKDCLQNGTTATIASNHGHVLMVSKEDVAAGVAKSYDIAGSAGHSHTVSLSADDFAKLKQNTSIMVTASAGGNPSHTHGVTVGCA